MGKISFKEKNGPTGEERLVISNKGLKGVFNSYSGLSGEFWVSIIPSLNTSGYGKTEQESLDDLEVNIDVFLKYLFDLPDARRQVELRRMGWVKSKYFGKKYSNSYVDKDGLLLNFDNPESVKSSRLQTA